MKTPGLAELKKELRQLSEQELVEVISALVKFSPDNKLFLYFQLFGRDHPQFFVDLVQEDLIMDFHNANTRNYHYAKKSAQVIRRKLNKYLKFTKDKTTKIDLIAFFCENLEKFGYLNFHHPVIDNLYALQLNRIGKLTGQLHEDLQFDYQHKIEELRGYLKYNGYP